MKKLMALMALMALTACDRFGRDDARTELDDGQYRAAMEDYRSGRLEAAIKGFEKAIVANPGNASARFQQACLLQDSRHDFVSAYCAYREYLRLRPDGDKVQLAKDRLAICEKEAAKELAARHGLGETRPVEPEGDVLRNEHKALRDRLAASERNLRESMTRIRALKEEKDSLMAAVRDGSDRAAQEPAQTLVKEARTLLDEDDEESAAPAVPGEAALLKSEDGDDAASSSLLPKPTGVAKKPAPEKKETPPAVDRPKTYVIQEGDTLYGISKRFYGTIAVWRKIREANKALIPGDNRLRAGDTIVLPEP